MSDFSGIPIYTDHRVPKDSGFLMLSNRISMAGLFADRSQVKQGCDCSYCTWEPPPLPFLPLCKNCHVRTTASNLTDYCWECDERQAKDDTRHEE